METISIIEIKGKQYNVRGLGFDDMEIISRIVEKTDFDLSKYESEAQAVMSKKKADLNKEGMKLFLKAVTDLLKKYHKAHADFTEFIASLIGVTPDEVKQLPITTPFKVLKELMKDEDSKDFLSSVVK
jgi:hypothetical protein